MGGGYLPFFVSFINYNVILSCISIIVVVCMLPSFFFLFFTFRFSCPDYSHIFSSFIYRKNKNPTTFIHPHLFHVPSSYHSSHFSPRNYQAL